VRVLVVDDELDPQALARMVLEQHGATVTTASSAAEARTVLDRGRFDVLVSDIGMPGEDGLSLLRTIRKRPAAAGGAIPALALTAFARATDRQAAIDAGFQEFLSKPVELTELLWAIARLIGREAAT
jgi:CheY-like chemotaxis protein